ncbi:hypothetical protein KKG29_02810 [Patescibacteria group bacterium]|nr:hypothetical protein [Patescibacteria group bacterium]MBU4000081.1 hypothetical protein [Patescibacteria group bacterium]MBU4056903.1 hypothetical protein [Patescibacteria group bacterium]MBU4368581.1 hypothetical protein [Patescibacteria group bacterium]
MVKERKKQTKKEKELAISRRNVQRLSGEIITAKKILRKVIKLLGAKEIEIKLTQKEKEFLTFE